MDFSERAFTFIFGLYCLSFYILVETKKKVFVNDRACATFYGSKSKHLIYWCYLKNTVSPFSHL